MSKRRKLSSDFKARAALEALREESGLSELSQRFDVHPTQISAWKKQALSCLPGLFSQKKNKEDEDRSRDVRDLHAKIGQLTVENDFFVTSLQTLSRERRKVMIVSSGKVSVYTAMSPFEAVTFERVPYAYRGKYLELEIDAADRCAVSGVSLLWQPSNDPLASPSGLSGSSQACETSDALTGH